MWIARLCMSPNVSRGCCVLPQDLGQDIHHSRHGRSPCKIDTRHSTQPSFLCVLSCVLCGVIAAFLNQHPRTTAQGRGRAGGGPTALSSLWLVFPCAGVPSSSHAFVCHSVLPGSSPGGGSPQGAVPPPRASIGRSQRGEKGETGSLSHSSSAKARPHTPRPRTAPLGSCGGEGRATPHPGIKPRSASSGAWGHHSHALSCPSD